jgi:NADH-ubiquinone oxidoreductase chain 5
VTRVLLILYYNSSIAWFSGIKTYLINRLGDGFLILSVVCLLNQGHWRIKSLDKKIGFVLVILLTIGLFTKRAQYPFCSWLPAAMAAPTPVSALVHSSTLVTAGVYVFFRIAPSVGSEIIRFVLVVRIYTMFIASLKACFEKDLKKVIALSTLRQLGLMCFSMGCGLFYLGLFHLFTHAVFKALLFIRVG